jgi:hypothetical protein
MNLDMPTKPISWLIANIEKDNIADGLDENTLQAIGADTVLLYEYDEASRTEWKKKIEAGIKTAKQIVEEKTFPWTGAANTRDSLMAEAAAQFAARAGGEVVRGQDVVKIKVTGADPDELKEKRAKRVSEYMSFECTDGMDEWEAENDQMLTSLSLIGMYYKKTFRDPILGRNVSYARSPMHVVVHEDTKALEGARITEEMNFNSNDVQERIRKGLWLDIADKMEDDEYASDEMFLEQHRTLDLDGDGYEEPYVVTVHKDSQAVCRIAACYDESGITKGKGNEVAIIERTEYFTEFPFLLSPDGKFHKIGWAHLLGPNTEVVNTIVNQLLDAGTLANCPPVFIGKGAKLPPGGLRVSPGRMIPVETTGQALKDNIVVQQLAGPSEVLFKLLELLNDKGQKLANLSDSMQGETGGANVPATTTLALLDQALKVYTSILKRLFRSYKQEFQKLYALDRKFLTDKEYITVIDITAEDLQAIGITHEMLKDGSTALVGKDFNENDKDIQPVMDPTASSEALRLARLNAMAQAAGMPPAVGRIYLEGIGVCQKDIDAIFPPVDPNAPAPPNPDMVKIQADIVDKQKQAQQKDRELDQKHAEIEQKEALLIKQLEKLDAEIVAIKAGAILSLANAEKAEIGTQIDVYKGEMEQLNADRDHELAKIQTQIDGQEAKEKADGTSDTEGGTGSTSTVAGAEDDQASGAVLQGQGSGSTQGLPGGELPPGISGGNGPMDGDPPGALPGVQPHASPDQLPPPSPMQ